MHPLWWPQYQTPYLKGEMESGRESGTIPYRKPLWVTAFIMILIKADVEALKEVIDE